VDATIGAAAVGVVVEDVEGGHRGAVVAGDDCSAAAVAASDVGVISTRCNMNERTHAR
jgi:hypothetical protein